jgi:hypothetical protein
VAMLRLLCGPPPEGAMSKALARIVRGSTAERGPRAQLPRRPSHGPLRPEPPTPQGHAAVFRHGKGRTDGWPARSAAPPGGEDQAHGTRHEGVWKVAEPPMRSSRREYAAVAQQSQRVRSSCAAVAESTQQLRSRRREHVAVAQQSQRVRSSCAAVAESTQQLRSRRREYAAVAQQAQRVRSSCAAVAESTQRLCSRRREHASALPHPSLRLRCDFAATATPRRPTGRGVTTCLQSLYELCTHISPK